MTTLADEGWIPVTAEQSQDGYTWRMWVRPDAPEWTFVEVRDELGRTHSGGVGEPYGLPEQPGPQFWTGTSDGFPTFVGVRFEDRYPGIDIETTRRQITVKAEQAESHFGKRYYAMPLRDDEELVAIIGGGVRTPQDSASGIDSRETGFYPFER
ncbi:hypothetical protein NONO_c62260 [Nocardia nova SH22a]|uniref:Uncharacterized protein n=1 Tax=Nocardia nova SH22a TaxID=1415166 RepID=W5TP18_9NOCA|nr:hypothetical protein [Nocardia nova]AHH20997.1 hypothetical protein NONO_c62260 [Nocardia nova SH22a]